MGQVPPAAFIIGSITLVISIRVSIIDDRGTKQDHIIDGTVERKALLKRCLTRKRHHTATIKPVAIKKGLDPSLQERLFKDDNIGGGDGITHVLGQVTGPDLKITGIVLVSRATWQNRISATQTRTHAIPNFKHAF